MGDRARRAFTERTSAGERLDIGLRLSDAAVRARLEHARLPDDLSPEERVRHVYRVLRHEA